jgi:hypothetical protein
VTDFDPFKARGGFVENSWPQRTGRAAVKPVLQLRNRNQATTAAPDYSKFVHDVFLQEVDAHAECLCGFRLAEGETRN